ncbi:hypothetical protein FB451DRAFT_1281702, partial [Mycena latifolia]
KTRDLFADRLERVDKKLIRKVLFFRSYLRVSDEMHRRALTQILLSGHALASERMTWGERYRPESVPAQWRLCRFCKVCIEDLDLTSRRKTLALLAKYAYDVLEVFYATPMLTINQAFYRQIAADPHPAQ